MSNKPVPKLGTTPNYLGQKAEVQHHELRAIEASLPCNDLVWECQLCGLVNEGAQFFLDNVCEAADD